MAEIFQRLAQSLLKCPFDEELFDSELSLRLHLCESHAAEICNRYRVSQPIALEGLERPEKLYFCGHCMNFVVPKGVDRNPIGEIETHIRTEHPNSRGPVELKFSASTDDELIDRFLEQQASQEVCACSSSDCGSEVFADEASVALHWAEQHCRNATVEELHRAVEAVPERFTTSIATYLSEIAEQEAVRQEIAPEGIDDGYVIRHTPSVPRVRSRVSEFIVYVEREILRLSDDELNELLRYEGLDSIDQPAVDEHWLENKYRAIQVELRFCNIIYGYIPLVKDVRQIVPDTALVEMSWQDEPDLWFPCQVSKSKRAIYNLDRKFIELFRHLPSGVRLNITRVGPQRFQLSVMRRTHTVPNCKFFATDETNGWSVEIRDETIEWDTGDEVFRHQLTFQQMEAPFNEARENNLSVRDATYDVMKRLAQEREMHVREVYDVVFLRMRTCSLAAVWAQFRPEHECYVRVHPGWYRFDQNKPFPYVRIVEQQPAHRTYVVDLDPRQHDIYRVTQRTWRHNIYKNKLDRYAKIENAYLEVRCAFGSSNEAIFLIPISHLMQHVIPHADCSARGQYLFSISQHDFIFTWDHGVRMEGKRFLRVRGK